MLLSPWILPAILVTLASGLVAHGLHPVPQSIQHLESQLSVTEDWINSCWRLLSVEGLVGCAGPDQGAVQEPIQKWTGKGSITDHRVVLVDSGQLANFVEVYKTDKTLQEHVKGILVDTRDNPSELSFGSKFPLYGHPSPIFPYEHSLHEWNPNGTGLRWENFDIPTFLLSEEVAEVASMASTSNSDRDFSGAVHVANIDSAAMNGKTNSNSCLEKKTCDPIGGNSVLAITPASSGNSKPVILIVARMDAAGVFLGQVTGADSSLSGLIAMLVAADLLRDGASQEQSTHRVAFLALAGEPWDYMGSKRIIWELQQGKNAPGNTIPFDLSTVDKIIEVDAVGLAARGNERPRVFVHQQKGPTFSKETVILDAFIGSAMSDDANIDVEMADSSNPGIPPSSLMVFLSNNPNIEGVVIAEYNQHYINPFFDSLLDDESNIDEGSISTAAILVAKAVHELAGRASSLKMDASKTKQLTADLINCMIKSNPPLNCELSKSMSTVVAGSGNPAHYTSVLRDLISHPQDQARVNNQARFLFNYLGQRVGDKILETECDWSANKCNESEVCLGPSSEGKRFCWASSVHFMASYPLSIQCLGCGDEEKISRFTLIDGKDADAVESFQQSRGWASDRIWTESRWGPDSPQLKIFTVESRSTEIALLSSGIVLFLVSFCVVGGTKAVFEHRLKQA